MAIEHRLTSTDTLRTLAQFYLNNSNVWQSIADFNGLTYPYIVETTTDRKNLVHGNGYVRMKRSNFRTARTVQQGWQLYTEHDTLSGQRKVFEVSQDVVFPEGEHTAYVHVRAVIQGVYGNIGADTRLYASQSFLDQGFQLEDCITVERFVGGDNAKVLVIGEYIYIPNEEYEIQYTDRERLIAFVGEEDIALDAEGELFIDGFGDIASVKGADNIVQAVHHRLMSERGVLTLHPEYGSTLHYLIGQAQSPYTLKLVELDVYDTLAYEDRISNINVQEIRIVGAVVYVHVSFTLNEIGREVRETLELDYRNRSGISTT